MRSKTAGLYIWINPKSGTIHYIKDGNSVIGPGEDVDFHTLRRNGMKFPSRWERVKWAPNNKPDFTDFVFGKPVLKRPKIKKEKLWIQKKRKK